MSDPIGVGIIGGSVNARWAPRTHIPVIEANDRFRLVAVATSNSESAQTSGDAYGVVGYDDHRRLIADDNVDMVVVAVRVPLHYHAAMDAIAAKKNIYVEWPLASNVNQAEKLVAYAHKNNVRTLVGLQGRVSPGHRLLRQLLTDDYVGRMLHCNITQFTSGTPERPSSFSWQADDASGYSALSVPFGHVIDAVCQSVGPFAELEAIVTKQFTEFHETDTGQTIPSNMIDTVMVNGVLQNGATASAHVGMMAPHHSTGFRLEIYGTRGTLIATSPQRGQLGQVRVFGGQSSESTVAEIPIPDELQYTTALPDPAANIASLYQRLEKAIDSNIDVEPSFEDALRLHRFLALMEESSSQGLRKSVPLVSSIGIL